MQAPIPIYTLDTATRSLDAASLILASNFTWAQVTDRGVTLGAGGQAAIRFTLQIALGTAAVLSQSFFTSAGSLISTAGFGTLAANQMYNFTMSGRTTGYTNWDLSATTTILSLIHI